MIRFLIILAVVFVGACGSDSSTNTSATPEIPATVDPDLVVCQTDDDCVAVTAGCCSCLEGGTATAVNKTSKNRWEVHRTEKGCSPGCCENEPSGDATCAAQPVCENGECKLR